MQKTNGKNLEKTVVLHKNLQIFLQGDTIFTVDASQSLDVQKELRFHIG